MLFCERGECGGEFWDGEGGVGGEVQDVNVRFYETDFGGEGADDIEDFGGGGYVNREAEVGAFSGDDAEEMPANHCGMAGGS